MTLLDYRNTDAAVTLPFNSIRSSMLRWRRTTRPNIPATLTELAEILQSGESLDIAVVPMVFFFSDTVTIDEC